MHDCDYHITDFSVDFSSPSCLFAPRLRIACRPRPKVSLLGGGVGANETVLGRSEARSDGRGRGGELLPEKSGYGA